MSNAPFPIDPTLTSISIAYKNTRLIADEVLPRVPPVPRQEFKWWKYALDETFRLPDTRVGRTSAPNEVEFSAEQQTSYTKDYALDDPIPNTDIENASEGYDPVGRAVEGLADLIMLDREKRCADLVFNPNSYPVTQQITLSGTSQFNDVASDPIGVITDAMDALIMRPNVLIAGRQSFTRLSRHPHILKAYNGNDGDKGIAPANFIADLFGLEKVLVGESWLVTSRKGQANTTARVWGKHIALLYLDTLANPVAGSAGRATFGLTVPWGNKIAGKIPDPNIGMRGGVRIRAGESVDEIICAPDCGYFIQNAVA